MRSKYKSGIVYILNGYGSQLTWEPSYIECSNIKIYTNLNNLEIYNLIEGSDPTEPTVHLITPKRDYQQIPQIELDDFIMPVSNNYYFILIDNNELNLKKREEVESKIKSLECSRIKVCNLKGQNYTQRVEFKDWYKSQPKEIKATLDRFNKSPWMLKKLKENVISLEDVIKENSRDLEEAKQYLYSLGKKESLELWRNMPSSVAYKVFLNQEMEKTGGYLIMAGGIKSPKKRTNDSDPDWLKWTPSLNIYKDELRLNTGIAPKIWYYYLDFINDLKGLDQKYYHILYLFALWIYTSTVCLKERGAKGISYKGKYINFYPSSKALSLFYTLRD